MFRKIFSFVTMLCIVGAVFFASAKSVTEEIIQPKPSKENFLTHEHTADCEKTSAEPVQIICILDRSGSMAKLATDTIGGYNSFLEKQKQTPGKAEVTTILFDNQYDVICENVDIQKAENLTSAEYFARGSTALLDALGRTITTTLGKMEQEKICPQKRRVLIMIMTDGLENASREFNKASVKNLIDATTKEYNWNYIFMGANMDSVSEAESIGISAKHAANYSHDSKGVGRSFAMMGSAASEVRENGSVGEDWKE